MKVGTLQLLEKAERAIQAAEVLLSSLGAEFAAGRAYYAMEQARTFLAAAQEFLSGNPEP